jgi:hypothetical protein
VECTIHRHDRCVPVRVREYLEEVRGLSAVWLTHPRRMLRHKAMTQCARVAFALASLTDAEEVHPQRGTPHPPTWSRPSHATQPATTQQLREALGVGVSH